MLVCAGFSSLLQQNLFSLPLTSVQALFILDIMLFQNDFQIRFLPYPSFIVISLGLCNTDFITILITLYFQELLNPMMY